MFDCLTSAAVELLLKCLELVPETFHHHHRIWRAKQPPAKAWPTR